MTPKVIDIRGYLPGHPCTPNTSRLYALLIRDRKQMQKRGGVSVVQLMFLDTLYFSSLIRSRKHPADVPEKDKFNNWIFWRTSVQLVGKRRKTYRSSIAKYCGIRVDHVDRMLAPLIRAKWVQKRFPEEGSREIVELRLHPILVRFLLNRRVSVEKTLVALAKARKKKSTAKKRQLLEPEEH